MTISFGGYFKINKADDVVSKFARRDVERNEPGESEERKKCGDSRAGGTK